MQYAGSGLISKIENSIMDICTGQQIQEIRSRLSVIIPEYDIREIMRDEKNPDLQEKIDMFFAAKRLDGLSEITLYDYGLNLRIFASQVKKSVHHITTDDIRMHLSQYNHLKRSSIATKLSILNSFFGWLLQEELIHRDPTRKIKPPKQEKRLPRSLTIEELELLRESCEGRRQRALLEVLYATGCRLAEMQRLDISDVDFGDKSTQVIGKGNKERQVFFSPKALFHLRKYLKERSDTCPALIVTQRRPYRRLGRRSIQRDIGVIAGRSGIQKPISPHVLRHTFATLMHNNGATLAAIQRMLGHSSPATTQRYAVLNGDSIREEYRKNLVQ